MLSELERKSETSPAQSIANIQQIIETFHNPFIDRSKSSPAQLQQQEKEAVKQLTTALTEVGKSIPIPAELIQQVSKNDLSSKKSMETLAQVVEQITESVAKQSASTRVEVLPQVQAAIANLKTTVETISLTKSKDGNLAKIFNNNEPVAKKTEQLLELKNPLAVARYVNENPVVMRDSLLSMENRKALISYILQEDSLKMKDAAEFNIFAVKTIEETSKTIDHKYLIDELLSAIKIVKESKADKAIVKAISLLDEVVGKGTVSIKEIESKMSEIAELIKYSPIPRSPKEINDLIKSVMSDPVNYFDIDKDDENVLDKTSVIRLIAKEFNLSPIPAVDVLGMTNVISPPLIIDGNITESYVSDGALGSINQEDVKANKVAGFTALIENIYKALDESYRDGFNYVLKNLEKLKSVDVISITEEVRASYRKLKEKGLFGFDELQTIVNQLKKEVTSSNLTIQQKTVVSEKLSSLNELIENIEQTRGKDQKIAEILNNQSMLTEDKVKELLELKAPEAVLKFMIENQVIANKNRVLIMEYIAKEVVVMDMDKFVALSEQILVSLKLTNKEKDNFVKVLSNVLKNMQSTQSESVVAKTLALLDTLVSSVQIDMDISKQIIPQLISSVRRESKQAQQAIVAKAIEGMNNSGRDGAVSQLFVQNFPEINRSNGVKIPSVSSSSSQVAKGTDMLISNIPVEVLAKDYSKEAVKSVMSQLNQSPKLINNEKVLSYVQDYITEYLRMSSWNQESFNLFAENVSNLLMLSKGDDVFNKLFLALINGTTEPQAKFVAVLKVLALYELNMNQRTSEQRLLTSKLRESYDKAIEYLMISLPTLGESVSQAVSYLSKKTRDKLREIVEDSLTNGVSLLKRGNEVILRGLNEVEGRKA